MWSGSVANQGGYPPGHRTTRWHHQRRSPRRTPQSREASTMLIEDTLNWLRGAHSLSIGGTFTQADVWLINQTTVPTVSFGVATGDPANAMFNARTSPARRPTERQRAQNLYAVLTGRVTPIAATRASTRRPGSTSTTATAASARGMRESGSSSRTTGACKPNLTLNVGLRYELQLPFYAHNDSYSTATIDDVWGVSGRAGCDPSNPTPRRATCSSRARCPGSMPTVHAARRRRRGVVQHRLEQLGAERRRQLDAERPRAGSSARCSAAGRLVAPRRLPAAISATA